MNLSDAYIALARNHYELAGLLRDTLGILQEQQYDGHRRHAERIRSALGTYNALAKAAIRPIDTPPSKNTAEKP